MDNDGQKIIDAFKEGMERGLAEGEAKGLERAAEMVKTAEMSDPLHAVVLFRSATAKALRDEAAKIREGK